MLTDANAALSVHRMVSEGPVVVPGALVPVQCSVEHGYAVYVEPAVWVDHELR